MSGAGLFEFLFKYRPVVFEHGDFTFVTTPGSLLVSLLVLALALLSLLAIRGLRDRISTRDRAVLASLRVAAFLLLFFCTLRPALIVPTAVPQENVLGVLLDDSLSMRLQDQNGLARSAVASDLFDGEEGRLVEALEERFKLRYFAFSSGTARVGGPQDLSYTGQRTDLGRALERVRQDLAAVPLSGLVVVTDGADNSDSELTESLLGLRARSIPVYTVGVGTDRFERDVEVERVEAPRSVLQGSSVSVDLIVSQRGYGGAAAELVIEESGRILKTESITLPGVGQTAPVRVHFTATEPGAHTYRFEIRPLPGERISENNARELLVTVEDDRRKILYFEGEPRFELKFIKRSIEDDENLHVVALERTAQDKFLRLDIENPEELIGGF
ncbi:hypothetical protein ACFL4Y_04040, partial [Gemmatimonadota bacterium]